MAVRYAYRTDPPIEPATHRVSALGAQLIREDGTIVRKTLIPESPDEELRGETYDQSMIDWHHNSEREHIARLRTAAAPLVDAHEVVEVWTEREDGTRVDTILGNAPD